MLASALVFYLVPWLPLALVALAVLAGLTWKRLDLALPLVVLFAPLYLLPKHLGSKEFAPSEIFLLLDVAVAAGWAITRRGAVPLRWTALRSSPFLVPGALFLLAGLLSTIVAADHHQALQAYRERILEPGAFAVLLLLLPSDFQRWRRMMLALLVAGVALGIIALYQRLTHQNLTVDSGSSFLKVRAVYGSPDNLGLWYDRVVPLWFALVLMSPTTRAHRLLWLLAGGVLLSSLFLTYSRGAWIAIALAVIAELVFVFRRRMVGGRDGVHGEAGHSRTTAQSTRPWIPLVTLAFVILVGAALIGPKIVATLQAGHIGTAQRRVYVWTSALHMLRDHPLFGIGPDNFLHYYAPVRQGYAPCTGLGYIDQQHAWQEPCLSHPHDLVLDLWLSTGILGLVAFLWMQVLFWRSALAELRGRATESRLLTLGVAGAMLAALLHGLVDNGYFLPDLAIVFWLFVGYASWLSTHPSVPRPAAPGATESSG